MFKLGLALLLFITLPFSQTNLIIRCDDTGMSHTANMGCQKLIDSGLPFSTSVMFACPWWLEAVEILKKHPEVSVGVHLTLNSEWKHYKWGPISGASVVPSLVDKNGYFPPNEDAYVKGTANLNEVEIELRAQIERGLNSGLKIDYIDYHMLTAVSTPELRKLVEELAEEYNLAMSRYFDEHHTSLWDVKPEEKEARLLKAIKKLNPEKTNLIVMHLGLQNPEMNAMIDLNTPSDPLTVSIHREAELNSLLSKDFRNTAKKNNVKFITYRDLVKKMGLQTMKRPGENSGY